MSGIYELMRADEAALGRTVVVPGDVPWLAEADWHHTVVVSRDGREVRLIAILALNPGRGAMRRCLSGIRAAGLRPVVVEPMGQMRDTLTRWGWVSRVVGAGLGSEEQWRPAPLKTYGFDAVRLYRAYSLEQLTDLRLQVECDPRSANPEHGKGDIYIFNKPARKRLDSIAWAVTYHLQHAKSGAAA